MRGNVWSGKAVWTKPMTTSLLQVADNMVRQHSTGKRYFFSKARVDLRDSAADELPLAQDIAVYVPTIMYLGYNRL